MLMIETEVKNSTIQGLGLFAAESATKGQLLAILSYQADILTEEEYQEKQRQGNDVITWSAVRWIGEVFLTGDKIGPEERINHSVDPTMLYHCGLCFAKTDINIGDELTVDYKYFLANDDVNKFKDSENIKVDGINSHNALIDSAKELINLFSDAKLT
ncbi:SET domain-containing protein [Vibrio sp. Of14-4]|uniref:SET domain-containing protein n=1 Tax=Vibrio tetraodonis subsp. pristinus TaxID=2695891 RepID=A0A6L8LRV4_9VIBR|nr:MULTISPECIES: SET domain-containing protein [Vibrio]MCG7490469.1 SET domain-containing protein [Vibrio sp. Of14-4]MYM58768.1 hypothetical protein [Vibrio tetraodonis subsp. pristinus]